MQERFVVAAGRVAPVSGPAFVDGAVLVEGGRVRAVGPRAEVLAAAAGAPLICDEPDGTITPGLVDAHTHAAWVGSRHDEYAVRLAGGDYEAIAKAGGGIVSSMRAVRAATTETIVATLRARLRRMAAMGVTTVEIKSGYGLDEAGERKQLDAIAEVARDPSLPRVIPTYLALHAIPPERRDNRASYMDDVASRWLPAIAAAGLARFVDAYVDRAAFTVDEARTVLSRARALGLGVRIHAGQFADVGAAELAAELGAKSADHLEQVGPGGLLAMAAAGTAAVLLPVASFTLGQTPPPVAAMRAAGVRMVVASDANPGTAPTESLPLAMAMAARAYGLTPDETLYGATLHAAASLDLDDAGTLAIGASADLVVWRLPHERCLIQPWGAPPIALVIGRGRPLFTA
jgi:imidazolonepropionase